MSWFFETVPGIDMFLVAPSCRLNISKVIASVSESGDEEGKDDNALKDAERT